MASFSEYALRLLLCQILENLFCLFESRQLGRVFRLRSFDLSLMLDANNAVGCLNIPIKRPPATNCRSIRTSRSLDQRGGCGVWLENRCHGILLWSYLSLIDEMA
jgi:hypothetical protein